MRPVHLCLLAASLALPLAACTPPTEVGATGCDADGYAAFIGENEEIFTRSTFPAPMRIIRPGDVVTQDFNPDRLNFMLDETGTIVDVNCG
ncbi:I78 family peptidase inhibitor [Pontivivens ytuae]|uniref:Peptidase inhibitor I78 family protein n=1 Tax=Pontivivens ytuae TaxID=2789856 RepID=A0A7S9QCQ2_9RHOB|nr:I78 family peptidase inhibitor [Pontivivens ytuae]QPH54468.1 hypothetical protein I0K15_01410 [Pontivivens ytuae]